MCYFFHFRTVVYSLYRGTSLLTMSDSGVFFCGPKGLGSSLHVKCNEYSDPDWSYVWGKENF